MADMSDAVQRAKAAWYRTGGRTDPTSRSGLRLHESKYYVELTSGRYTLAVYRVLNNGNLKRLKRPPKGLVQGPMWSDRNRAQL
jgi:hypothetical protein